ncbi:conserved hypothetical protein [Xanthomonas citri pv. fuscans]|uniref:hypothetical protein n=1 Tax=Xanthomonas citri TaxID=346 RepID=UPI000C196FAE|nr:hypothetical protein [Xanthomonas citri]ATS52144.1 hypothetical protein XcfCFBP6992P_15745 [Xanthomonas citri pv. phaseoli var. fuscans]ATS53976.1 hypothetical protein XcfCFBP6994P_01330 [Xanthomonas citri pv. phaseoli var. fuscans]QWN16745.1 hypothetical protein DGN02_13700 [Xanthomonas citri]SOO18668.1 conserved hypothetical protein [Xanthomonas citri pv. fuscans]SOO32642.1 conserved hypothetical protein [Xanthomonas citri pv. fuscans]
MRSNFAVLEKFTESAAWSEVVADVLGGIPELPWGYEDFGTHWIVAGHRIREQVANDRVLAQFLRKVLPPYSGASLVLFRGESRERFSAGKVGLSWSKDRAIAELFARGLNSIGGGLVLRAAFCPEGIIAAPNAHSFYLGEHQYTVDPSAADRIEVVGKFPSNAT